MVNDEDWDNFISRMCESEKQKGEYMGYFKDMVVCEKCKWCETKPNAEYCDICKTTYSLKNKKLIYVGRVKEGGFWSGENYEHYKDMETNIIYKHKEHFWAY